MTLPASVKTDTAFQDSARLPTGSLYFWRSTTSHHVYTKNQPY